MRSSPSYYTRGSAKRILSPYGVCEAARPGRIVNADIYVALGETSSPEGLDVEDTWLRLPEVFCLMPKKPVFLCEVRAGIKGS